MGEIMSDYLKITCEYQEKYGENTLLMMQVGAFFEVYGLKNTETGEIIGSKITDFIQICQLNIADKKIVYKDLQVVMAGVRDYVLDKYIKKMVDAGYTTVIYGQEKDGKKITRSLIGVYSAGSLITYDTDESKQMSNNTMCIWIELYEPIGFGFSIGMSAPPPGRKNIVCGVSVINTFTGKSAMFEYSTSFFMNPTTFDELERFVTIYSPSELIFISPFDEKTNETIKQYIGIRCNVVHDVITTQPIKTSQLERIKNSSTQTYIQHTLTKFFGEDSYNICSEFTTNTIATQALCYLLHFLQEHNQQLVRKISIPEQNNTSNRLVLANHTLKQLNIIDDQTSDKTGISNKYSSVLTFLNKCCTIMGKRKFTSQLLNPTTDEEWLNNEYRMTELLLDDQNNHFVDVSRKELNKVRDIEKISRQILVRRVYPNTLYGLVDTIQTIKQLHTCFYGFSELIDYLVVVPPPEENTEMSTTNSEKTKKKLKNTVTDKIEKKYKYVETLCDDFINYMENTLILEKCRSQNTMSFENSIIQSGVSQELDVKCKVYEEKLQVFHILRNHLNLIAKSNENDKDLIKIHETEKSGLSLQITKTRGEWLKPIIKDIISKNDEKMKISIQLSTISLEFSLKDIKFVSANATTYDIEIPALERLCKDILLSKEQLNAVIVKVYNSVIEKLDNDWIEKLAILTTYVTKLDVLQSKAYLAKTYNYCCPKIKLLSKTNHKSYVMAKQLRHCLIEQLLVNELYEANDISIGTENVDGILLYGTNAVGKTSIIRALGISVIMAQAGLFVPCSEFTYQPYQSIFTRILGNDNLFKGLSTFAVEMSELRIILKMATENSLVLGDELCSGTETESALSIFVAGIMELYAKQSSFIFATHFHEILKYEEVTQLERLSVQHMSVLYDREKDCLIYDRKLKKGSGIRTYGLEVCKSLYLEKEFLEKAYTIRNKYFPESRGELDTVKSKYNAKKLRGICEVCKTEIAEETHHLQEQQLADKNGFIGNFHKNHVANLIAVCEKCHNDFHLKKGEKSGEKKTRRKKTTDGYTLL